MKISVATAMLLRVHGDNIRCTAISNTMGKWSGNIDLWKSGAFQKTLLNTNFNYDSEEEAVKEMKKIVACIRATDLYDQKVIENLSVKDDR